MLIIPVLDLMQGQVVHGLSGEREHYRPLKSVLTQATAPLAVARALQAATDCRAFYIADLDAIQGLGSDLPEIRKLCAKLQAELWIDAGITGVDAACELLEAGASRVIVGSETLSHLTALRTIAHALPAERLLFSLDIAHGRVLSRAPALKGSDPLAALSRLIHEGWSQLIILTLDQVGTGGGPDWPLLNAARTAYPSLSIIAGGGVRTPDDLQGLAKLGVDGVLVASALHRGWITRKDLQALVTSGGVSPAGS